ncbi:putative PurR-regulated permease PerM [Pseudoduganella flava]|uniref:Putative PurR-regulated permease PerM n=1 Tax=Pseudoduganella flava TaxID=871742 RepID=A0A562Q1I4_9BURK|nr:putative PurR-regulated permease PerM [Pseudoduganella flava]
MPVNRVVTATCLIAILHFGRGVLQPIVLALVLSLALAPLIRAIGTLGLARVHAIFAALALVFAAVAAAGTVLGAQMLALTAELPQYRAEIRAKLEEVRVLTEQPLARLPADLLGDEPLAGGHDGAATLPAGAVQPVPVEIRTRATTQDTLAKAVAVVSGPLGAAGLVLVLLIFILLDHENLRDRIIRLTGQREVSRTIRGLEDAAHGVSRFFFSQFVVNLVFGAVSGIALWLLGLPHAALWGALCAVLRFVPYIGALIAAAGIGLFAAAVDPGWALAVYAMVLFGVLEVLVANVVEPRVYGHSSGMSPLAVIVSALFWSALWGPVGLLLSTPLTLCLVVAGRYIKELEPVSILLAESPNASDAQRFYHRVLSGDAAAIIRDARAFLRKYTLARYCDQVLLPGLALASADLRGSQASQDVGAQQQRLRATIAMVADTLDAGAGTAARRTGRRSVSLLNETIGAHLRHAREERLGRWQGSLDVPERSIVLCASLEGVREEFLSELLVLALREAEIDARSVVLGKPDDDDPPDAERLVSSVIVAWPMDTAPDVWYEAVAQLRDVLPDVPLVTIQPRGMAEMAEKADPGALAQRVDLVLQSFEEALAFVAPVKSASQR